MRYHISEHKNDIITNLISNAIWYILIFCTTQIFLWSPLIIGIIRKVKNGKYSIPIYAFILVGISIFLMLLLVVVTILVLLNLYKGKNNSELEIKTDLIFNSLDIELYFKDRINILTYLTYDCVVNKDNYNEEFKKQIIWTGGTYNYTKIIKSNGDYSLTDSNRNASPHTYIIDFNKTFLLRENMFFKLETSVTDDDLSMTPVFSHMIKHQTIKFNIHLSVPQNLITNVRPAVYRDIARTIKVPHNIQIEAKNVGNLIQYSYTIDNPNLLNNYCIEWDFI